MLFRTFSGVMAALFAFAVTVQYNDADPVRWMITYGAACAISTIVAVRGTAPLAASAAVAAVALAWGVTLALGVGSLDVYTSMFDAWEMKSVPIEEAREASGLLLIAAWMTLLSLRTWTTGQKARPSTRNRGGTPQS